MRLVLPLLVTLSIAAQTTQPGLIAHTRSGRTIQIDRPAPGRRSFIVEFREAPRGARTLIDQFRRDLGRAGRQPQSQTTSATPRITHEFTRALYGASVVMNDAEAAAVRSFAYVKAVHEDAAVRAFASDEDTTHVARIGAPRVWTELGSRGKGIDVVVIDTGVDYTHPALASRYAGGWDFVAGDDDPMDEHGHGTHVAGIIAGTTEDVPGVAPEARIWAYRVLDAAGTGSSSNIVAAIERAMDPNQDGDTSDHLDVANLSLGGAGNADSPTSTAADRAMAAGVVVCLAAGNTPGGQTIGAPAASRRAITVGSSDVDDVLALYSSRGPAYPDFHAKPDVVAPGSAIRSAKLGGGTIVYSGTSMASPHAAGAAALLLALHSDWTPDDVKAALVEHAKPINVDVMSQGGGRIDVYASATSTAAIVPAVMSMGRNGSAAAWTATKSVRVTNHSSRAQTFTASGSGATIDPPSFTLDPGASRDVSVTVSVAGGTKPAPMTLSHGGRITFTSGSGITVVPWASVQAALVTVASEEPQFLPSVIWSCDDGTVLGGRSASGRSTALVPHGRCELIAVAESGIGESAIVLQSHTIDADRDILVGRAQAPYTVDLAGVDQEGKPIGEIGYTPAAPYYCRYSVELPEPSLFRGFTITTFSNAPLHISDMPDGSHFESGEVLYDFAGRRIIGIQHPRMGPIRGAVTLHSLPSDLHHARLEIAPRPGNLRGWTAVIDHQGGGAFYSSEFGTPLGNGWSGDVYVTADGSPDSLFAPGVHTEDYPAVQLDVTSPALRAIGGRIVFSNDRIPAPNAYGVPEGGTLRIGEPLIAPRTFFDVAGTAFRLSVINVGPAGEARYAWPDLDYELRRGSEVIARGRSPFTITADPKQKGEYQLDVRTQRLSTLSLKFDTSREDSNPPTLTSFRIDDGTLLFSTGDYALSDFDVNCYELRSTRAFVRAAGGGWRELAVIEVVNDRGDDLGHFETGTLYRASLEGVSGAADVRVDMEDLAGNTASITVENVLAMPLRKRSVR